MESDGRAGSQPDVRGELAKLVAPVQEIQQRLQHQLGPLIAQAYAMRQELAAAIAPVIVMQQQLSSQLAPFVGMLAKAAAEVALLPPRISKVQRALAFKGWFLGLDVPVGNYKELEDLIDSGQSEALCGEVRGYYEKEFGSVFQRIKQENPTRVVVLEEAFWGHAQKRYALSTPVFLSQSDGILAEAIEMSLFVGREREQFRAMIRDFDGRQVLGACLSPFLEDLPLFSSERDRGEGFVGLNRHQVLHGEVSDYGTFENSLKALSLLDFVSSLSGMLKERRQSNGSS